MSWEHSFIVTASLINLIVLFFNMAAVWRTFAVMDRVEQVAKKNRELFEMIIRIRR